MNNAVGLPVWGQLVLGAIVVFVGVLAFWAPRNDSNVEFRKRVQKM